MDKIYDEYFDKIYNWTIKKTDTREEAEDLTNDIFLAIYEYLNKNIKTVQFHPEACAGPLDTDALFDEFIKMMEVK